MTAILDGIEGSLPYWVALGFFAAYPIVSSLMWISLALNYFARRELRKPRTLRPPVPAPPVSVLIPAYCEEQHIVETVEACLAIDYPDFEVVVVDDGSTDATLALIQPYVAAGRIRVVVKSVNEGKAMAINDAIPCLRGEIVLIIDADACPAPGILSAMVPHFESARVAAVTGNPRVVDRRTLLAKLQVIEFTSIVSLLRRAQRVWGRVLTVSGVATAFRRSALVDVGLFSPDMATEDIDVTWRLQKRFYDVRYEPQAVVWMRVPTGLRALWRQRRRWAVGLAQVLRRHASDVFSHWRHRRMWPVVIEAMLSIVWAYLFVGLTLLWAVSLAFGRAPAGASPFPNVWGMTIATLAVTQLAVGVLLDARYERSVMRSFPIAVLYPVGYWMLMAVVTAMATPRGVWRGRAVGAPIRWRTIRGT
ncbi:MAG TPA: glycosyltransferase [Nitriliruptorales bacterium]|nr:glycosyltransferase [Nitriliruptorales bacterium]